MIPRYHIVLGALFTGLIYFVAPETKIIYLSLIFLSSFLIDFDHYVVSLIRTRKASLSHAINYHREVLKKELEEKEKGIRQKGDFHLFHTLEFHILIGILAIFFVPLFYIFIGMVFHSLIDVTYLLIQDRFYRREFFFFNWLRNKF